MCQHNLGLALQTAFVHHGRINDIDEAVALFDEALRELPEAEPRRANVSSSLSIIQVDLPLAVGEWRIGV
jgi:hypothetical protein